MDVRKKVFQGIIILELMIISAMASFIVARAQPNTNPPISPPPQTSEPSPAPQTAFTSTPSPSPPYTPMTFPGSLTPTPVKAGPRLIQVALSQQVLSSLVSSKLGPRQNMLTDFQVIPMENNEMTLKFNLQIAVDGFTRVLPIEIDSIIGLDGQQNLQLHILHLKRDGLDAGPTAATQLIQTDLNQLLVSLLMSQIHTMLKDMKLIGVQTSATLCCVHSEMLVLLLQLN